ncbi:hypothetical protein Q8F55_001684 [Vanrija albida]|uniref:Uncharacterized protein n=1 Tax=Vanrija albida TaxID=181172 RepID=A0ABR3Q7W1_9TREE
MGGAFSVGFRRIPHADPEPLHFAGEGLDSFANAVQAYLWARITAWRAVFGKTKYPTSIILELTTESAAEEDYWNPWLMPEYNMHLAKQLDGFARAIVRHEVRSFRDFPPSGEKKHLFIRHPLQYPSINTTGGASNRWKTVLRDRLELHVQLVMSRDFRVTQDEREEEAERIKSRGYYRVVLAAAQ